MKYPEYIKRVKKLLKKTEWRGNSSYLARKRYIRCPCCRSHKRLGHKSDCELDLLQKEVPE